MQKKKASWTSLSEYIVKILTQEMRRNGMLEAEKV